MTACNFQQKEFVNDSNCEIFILKRVKIQSRNGLNCMYVYRAMAIDRKPTLCTER